MVCTRLAVEGLEARLDKLSPCRTGTLLPVLVPDNLPSVNELRLSSSDAA